MCHTISAESITRKSSGGNRMTNITISSKGWVVIPSKLRKKYGLKPGSQVKVIDYGGVLALVPLMENPIQEAVGMLESDTSLTEALLEEHSREVVRER